MNGYVYVHVSTWWSCYACDGNNWFAARGGIYRAHVLYDYTQITESTRIKSLWSTEFKNRASYIVLTSGLNVVLFAYFAESELHIIAMMLYQYNKFDNLWYCSTNWPFSSQRTTSKNNLLYKMSVTETNALSVSTLMSMAAWINVDEARHHCFMNDL